jgi:hypothetical protein
LTVVTAPDGHASGTAAPLGVCVCTATPDGVRQDGPVILIVPSNEVALIEVARVKRDMEPHWHRALEEPGAILDGATLAEVLELIERLPESETMRCFTPGFGIRVHDKSEARAEVLFCFHCHNALMIDLANPKQRQVWASFDPDSAPARELLSRFQNCLGEV